ncbi:MAG TPA: hypothetical protein VEN81_00430 [Planctomycetota bacterium]|nr:hypothetical protein [Planctomycetota bacterium]
MSRALAAPRMELFPTFRRQSITWRTAAPGWVELEILLANDSDKETAPGELVLESAALGAFVPFGPVTRIAVGALEPGDRRRIRARVPRILLPGPGRLVPAMADALSRLPDLTAEVVDLMKHAEWAGNLNVYFDRRPERAVEVHRAFGLELRAGRPVMFMVDLPSGGSEYRIEVTTTGPDWSAVLASPVAGIHFLVVTPPGRPGLSGGATVLATRLRDSRTVPVEFTFQTVEGPGGSLGCIGV